MDVDLEIAAREGKSRFDRRLAALVGAAAILASMLATLEMYSGKREERAFTLASRMSNEIATGTAVSGIRSSFLGSALSQAAALGLEATTRQLAALETDAARVTAAIAAADERASQRLLAIAEGFASDPGSRSGLDETTRQTLTTNATLLTLVVAEQNRQVDLAERYGDRENAAIFALALLAIAAVLLGLAGIIGDGRQGTRILGLAGATLTVSALWGFSSLLR